MFLSIEPVRTDEELAAWLVPTNAVWRHDPLGVPEAREVQAAFPEHTLLLARDGGVPVGAAYAGVAPDGTTSSRISVVPQDRLRGVGTALYDVLSRWGRARNLTEIHGWVPFEDPDGLSWARRRGFVETGRELVLALELAQADPPRPPLPAEVGLTTLAERPELLPRLYAIAEETGPDVPGYEGAPAASHARWIRGLMDGPTHVPEATFVALLHGEPVGFAKVVPKLSAPGVAWNGYTAVLRRARKRGIARALKTEQIRWANANGYALLLTRNEERNAPIRHLNESFGYRPHSGRIRVRGPLALPS